MRGRWLAAAALFASFAAAPVAAEAAPADCLWAVGMAETKLEAVARAAPLAHDPALPLGPGRPDYFSGAEEDFADRAMRAFSEGEPAEARGDGRAGVIDARIIWAQDRLAQARRHAGQGDPDACAAALDQAREAIAGARAAFR